MTEIVDSIDGYIVVSGSMVIKASEITSIIKNRGCDSILVNCNGGICTVIPDDDGELMDKLVRQFYKCKEASHDRT